MSGVIGIDIGQHGGLAHLGPNGLDILPMPVIGGELNLAAIRDFLLIHKSETEQAFLELIRPFHKASKKSCITFGRLAGAIEGVLTGVGIPFEIVPPHVWMKSMHAGLSGEMTTKERGFLAATRLFPTHGFKKKDDGLYDAALLAAWGQRKLRGQA